MPETLTFRNLTAQTLTLKLVERFKTPTPENSLPNGSFFVNSLTQNFTTLMSNLTGSGSIKQPINTHLGENARSFADEEVDVRLEPFTTHKTQIYTADKRTNEILRLTFQGDRGARWRIHIPGPNDRSQTLTALAPNLPHEYTGVFLPDSSLLAIYNTTNLHCWMRSVSDNTRLSALSIPGTHNSPTYYRALPSVRCQAVSPREQLDNGVRFFDIRVQPLENSDSDELQLVHGVFPISLTGPKKFHGILHEVLDFLKHHPSETVILSLKREGTGKTTDQQLADILKDHYANPREWYTEPRIPRLGEVRGRIVLMRRFVLSDRLRAEWGGKGWAINAEYWTYNTSNDHHGDVHVQDFCEVLDTENIDKKIRFCCDHLERAAAVVTTIPDMTVDSTQADSPGPLYLNFLSASNFWKVGCWPDKIAAKLNPALTAFLCEKHNVDGAGLDNTTGRGVKGESNGDGGVGIVVCDWIGERGDWDLVRCIIGMNSRLIWREQTMKK